MGRDASPSAERALERVARLELENAALRARIERIRAHDALEDTVATRRPPPRGSYAVAFALGVVIAGTVIGAVLGASMQGAMGARASQDHLDLTPTLAPMPPTPPVYGAPTVGTTYYSFARPPHSPHSPPPAPTCGRPFE